MKNRNLYIFLTIVITSYLHIACSTPAAGEPPLSKATKPDRDVAFREADLLFSERRDIEKLREAVRLLSQMRDPADRNFDVEWRFARLSYFLGKQTTDDNEASAVLEKGKEAGKIASRIAPDRPEGHFWYGANLGELASLSPITVGIKAVDDIREAMNAVVAIDPAYQSASAFDALAQVEMKTRLYGGKAEKAVEFLEEGLKLDQTNANLHANLAEAYLAVKRDADAKRQIDTLLKLEPNKDYLIEHEAAVKKAKRLLETSF